MEQNRNIQKQTSVCVGIQQLVMVLFIYQLCGFEQIYLASVSSSVKCLLNFKMLFVVLMFLK